MDGTTDTEPGIRERRVEAWLALAAEPAVRAAERALATGSAAALTDALALAAASEARRRLEHALELRDRAGGDPARRAAADRAADDLRAWAAGVYLAALREPRPRKPDNPHTEESISIRRRRVRPPFPAVSGSTDGNPEDDGETRTEGAR